MREIKFRAWTGTEMLYSVIPVNEVAVITGIQGVPPSANVLYRHDIKAIMQFTGLKEIYEGDILRIDDRWNGQVCFDFQGLRWGIDGGTFYCHLNTKSIIRVVGNIHENPDLLK